MAQKAEVTFVWTILVLMPVGLTMSSWAQVGVAPSGTDRISCNGFQEGRAEILLVQGITLFKQRQFEAARKRFEAAVAPLESELKQRSKPAEQLPPALLQLLLKCLFWQGRCAYERDDPVAAMELWGRVLKLRPDSSETLYWIGVAQEGIAQRWLVQIRTEKKRPWQIKWGASLTLYCYPEKGNMRIWHLRCGASYFLTEAMRRFKRALELAPGHPEAKVALQHVQRQLEAVAQPQNLNRWERLLLPLRGRQVIRHRDRFFIPLLLIVSFSLVIVAAALGLGQRRLSPRLLSHMAGGIAGVVVGVVEIYGTPWERPLWGWGFLATAVTYALLELGRFARVYKSPGVQRWMTAEEIAGHVLVGILFFVGLYLFSYPVARLDPTVGEDWCILLSFALMAAIWSREMEPIPAWLLGPMGWLVAFARAWSEISESGSQRAWHDLNTDAARDDVLVNTDAARDDVLVRAPESGSQRAWHDFNTPYEERTARERAEREARRAWEAELRERMYENWADGNFSNPFRIPGTGPIDN